MTAFQFLLDWTIRSALLILCGAVLVRTFRVKDAATRLAAYTAILCASFVLPALTVALPHLSLPIFQPAPPDRVAPAPPIESAHQITTTVHRPAPAAQPADWRPLLYIVPAAVLLLRILAGLLVSRRLIRRSRPSTLAPDILDSDSMASPAVLGIIRPIIVLPADWRDWPAPKLEAVLAHERSHILRRDPAVQLLSALHRALLWHSPLSWYLHRQIVRASEDASDDAAITATRDAAGYAATLLDFLQRSPLGSLGMARYGSPEQRIHRILETTAIPRGLTWRGVAAILAVAAPLALLTAIAHPQAKPSSAHKDTLTFEAASLKPTIVPDGVTLVPGGRLMSRKGAGIRPPRKTGGPGTDDPGRIHWEVVDLKYLLDRAWKSLYEVRGPDWLGNEAVALDATMPASTTELQFQEMLRNLIAERFALKYHTETKEVPGYTLTVANGGLKMKESTVVAGATDVPPNSVRFKKGDNGFPAFADALPPGRYHAEFGSDNGTRIVCQWCDIPSLAAGLRSRLNAPIKDATGLTAKYDYTLTFARDPEPGAVLAEGANPLPNIFAALQSQLGLKLDRAKVSVEIMVIDHIERTPSGN
jgi:uncharacterized protein (TIGR03435 family)